MGEPIGLETHPETDQFLHIDAGQSRCVMGPSTDNPDFTRDVSDGWAIQVPAGIWHDVINIVDDPLRLCTVHAPVHHAQATAAEAEADEKADRDEPRPGPIQPGSGAADGHV